MRGLALGLLLGSWLHMQQAELGPASQDAVVCACALLGLSALLVLRALLPAQHGPWARSRALLVVLAAACLAYGQAGWRAALRLQDRLQPALWGRAQAVEGVIVGLPALGARSMRFTFEPAAGQGLPRRIMVSWAVPRGCAPSRPDCHPRIEPGQAWRLPLRLAPPHGGANPAGFDAELWMFTHGIGATATVSQRRGAPAPRLLPAPRAGPVTALDRLRSAWRERIAQKLAGHPRAGSIAALTLGDQAAVGAAEWAVYRDTGVAHLMAISGLHISMFAGLVGGVGAMLWRRSASWTRAGPLRVPTPLLVAWCRLAAACAYGLIAGMGIPAQRAVLMLAVGLLPRLLGVRLGWSQTMAWALALVLAWDPWAVAQPGFWLSFGAVSLLFLGDAAGDVVGDRAAPRQADPGRVRAWMRRLAAAARAQWAVGVGLAPLTLVFFQQVPLLSPLANALAIPPVTLLVVPLAVAGLLLPAPLHGWVWQAAAGVQELVLQGLSWLARVPGSQWHAPAVQAPVVALAGLGVLALVVPWGWRLRLAGVGLTLPMLLAPGVWVPPGHVQAWLADVGQGSAVVVQTARHTLVFDTGPPFGAQADAGQRVVVPLLRWLGARPDLIVVSHGDADHIGGAAALARAYPGTAALGGVDPGRLRGLGLRGARRCAAGQRWVWDGVAFEMLHPAAEGVARDDNRGSCVLRVAGRGGSMLLTGDIGRAQETALLLAAPETLRADLLVVPHHGSGGSSSEAFVDAVAPGAAAVQCGFMNRYGHPHPRVLGLYAQHGVQLWRNDRDGALLWDDRRPRRLQAWRDTRRRFWHWRGAAFA